MLKICYSFLYFVWADCIISAQKSLKKRVESLLEKKVKLQKGRVCTEQGQDLELCNR